MNDMEITEACGDMRVYLQAYFDARDDYPGIIGVTYDPSRDVYNFHLNATRIGSHSASEIPSEEMELNDFLTPIAETASTLARFSHNGTN